MARVRRVGPDGVIQTVAGNGTAGYSGDGGPAVQAQLDRPEAIAIGPDGALYIADRNNNRIRRVGADGVITTVAGNGLTCGSLDTCADIGDGGPATAATVTSPSGVAVGPDGALFLGDNGSFTLERDGTLFAVCCTVRRVGSDGIITRVAGTGTQQETGDVGDGGPAAAGRLSNGVRIGFGTDRNLQAIEALDLRPLQVLIEGLIVEVRRDRRFELGVSAAVSGQTDSTQLIGELVSGTIGDLALEVIHLGKVDIDAVVQAVASKGDVSVLSRPVIVAQNNQEARILIGAERPFVQVFRS